LYFTLITICGVAQHNILKFFLHIYFILLKRKPIFRQALPLMIIAVFTLLVKWCLNMEARYGLLFPGLYCFPLLMAGWGVESGLQQVRKPGNQNTSDAVLRIRNVYPGSRVKKIPDPGFGSAQKNLSIFNTKNCFQAR
jgi:hypothetical protein